MTELRGVITIRPLLALSVAASVALSGCATRPLPTPSSVSVRGPIPAGGLPTVARIVADDQPIELPDFVITPENRAEFEKRRSKNIDRRVDRTPSSLGNNVARCLFYGPLCWVASPVILPAAATADSVGARIKAHSEEPSLISEKDGARLAALFTEHASGASLSERTLRLIESAALPSAKESEYPRLVVRVKSVRAFYAPQARKKLVETPSQIEVGGRLVHFRIIAQAQAYPSAGAEWAPTEHESGFPFRRDDELAVRGIEETLDVLAQSIVSTYLPAHPSSVEQSYWESVGGSSDPAELQTYLDRYPEGKYAGLARKRIAALAEVARRKAAREAPIWDGR